jgi:hypothetical protein
LVERGSSGAKTLSSVTCTTAGTDPGMPIPNGSGGAPAESPAPASGFLTCNQSGTTTEQISMMYSFINADPAAQLAVYAERIVGGQPNYEMVRSINTGGKTSGQGTLTDRPSSHALQSYYLIHDGRVLSEANCALLTPAGGEAMM